MPFLFRRSKVLTGTTFTCFYVADNRVTSLALVESDHASLGIKVTRYDACAIVTMFSGRLRSEQVEVSLGIPSGVTDSRKRGVVKDDFVVIIAFGRHSPITRSHRALASPEKGLRILNPDESAMLGLLTMTTIS